MKKIFILTIIELTSNGEVSFDVLKYDHRHEAEAYGDEKLSNWVAEHTEEDDDGSLIAPYLTRYPNLVEANDRDTIAEFDYYISEFEV